MDKVKILRDARALLVIKGWIQGGHGDDIRGYCASGAIMAAMGQRHGGDSRECQVCIVCDIVSTPLVPLARWNDAFGRTKQEVLAAFDKAIEFEVLAALDKAIEFAKAEQT
jgi:hypothetical protein